MSQVLNSMLSSLIVLLALSSHNCNAENATILKNCYESTSLNLTQTDLTQLAGSWYEVARNPLNNDFCTQINLTIVESQAWIFNTFSINSAYPWLNYTYWTHMNKSSLTNNIDGYNISYYSPSGNLTYTEYKILETDYNNYVFMCGYTNSSSTTEFALILARNRNATLETITEWENLATNHSYANFNSSIMSLVSQNPQCYIGGTTSIMPSSSYIYALISLVYLVYNLVA